MKKSGGLLAEAQEVEFSKDDPFSMGIFGGPTTGKTTIVSTFPKPILMLVCSGGIKKPGELRSIPKAVRKDVKQIVIKGSDHFSDVCEELKEDEEFATVSLEHLTSFSDLVLSEILGVDRVKPQLAWGDVQQQQWQKHGSLVKEHLRRLIELQKFTTIICHERAFEPKDESELATVKMGPAVTPTIAAWLTGTLDYFIQTFLREEQIEETKTIGKKTKTIRKKTGNQEFCAYLPMNSSRMTKWRRPPGTKMDPIMVNATFDKLVAMMED